MQLQSRPKCSTSQRSWLYLYYAFGHVDAPHGELLCAFTAASLRYSSAAFKAGSAVQSQSLGWLCPGFAAQYLHVGLFGLQGKACHAVAGSGVGFALYRLEAFAPPPDTCWVLPANFSTA